MSNTVITLAKWEQKALKEMEGRILCDNNIRFGLPRIPGNVSVAAIVERFMAGESTTDLAIDYGVTFEEIDNALRFRLYR